MIQFADRLKTVQEYYFSKKLREVRALQAAGKPILNLGIGSPDLMPPSEVIQEITNSVTEEKAHQYQSYQGIPELRKAITSYYQSKFSVALDVDEVLPLMGSKEGIMHVSLAMLNEGDEVLIPNPGYPTYTSVTKLLAAKPIYYDLTEAENWQPDFNALDRLDTTKIKLMWLNYPHMPTGEKAQEDTFEKLIAFAKKNQILLVNDNPYSFILNDNPQSILQYKGAKEVALELNSLSKTFNMAGWRVGMLLGKESYLQQILKVKSNMDSGMFYGIQKGAVKALQLTEDWYVNQNRIYKKRKTLLWQLADKLQCTYSKDTTGLFVWAKLPKGIVAEDFVDDLLYNKNVFITPGTIFGTNGEGYVRLSLCVSEEVIEEVIRRI